MKNGGTKMYTDETRIGGVIIGGIALAVVAAGVVIGKKIYNKVHKDEPVEELKEPEAK